MKLVCSLPSLSNLSKISTAVDGILLEDTEDILKNICMVQAYHLIAIYKLNDMMFPKEVEEIRKKILLTKDTGCLYYITDLGVAHILKTLGLIDRTIYDPMTLITNSLDAKVYMEYGFEGIGISNEITIQDVECIISKSKMRAFLQVFGYRLMLNTRRKLISLYQEKIKKEFPKENLLIQEATRKDFFPIRENENGTKIYRGYILSLLEEFSSIPLEYAYLDSFGIEENIFLQVVFLFSKVKNGESIDEAKAILNSLNLSIQDGFSYQDSVYMKEEF